MFDDSKRLDKLEADMAALQKAHGSTVDKVDKNFTQVNENNKVYGKNFEVLQKEVTDLTATVKKLGSLEDAVKKLQARVSNLEAAVKKLGK
jgi:chromosome segregation ATPase